MDQLLSALQKIPEFNLTLNDLSSGSSPVCLNGLSHIHKAHFAAAVYRQTGRPMAVICHDELEASRMRSDLAAFLGAQAGAMPARELALYDAVSVSRGWEQKRLGALYEMAAGKNDLFVFSLDCVLQRTIPKDKLLACCFEIKIGGQYDIYGLGKKLVDIGYKRGEQVEGQGQFSIRGGILDIYSPAHDSPVRAEFFGDSVDSMGMFDTTTQRRIENLETALVLPSTETVAALHDGGVEGLTTDLEALITRLKRRKNPNEALIKTLSSDIERLKNDLSLPSIDRYMSLIYPESQTAADYIPKDAIVVICEHGSITRRADTIRDEHGLELDSLLASGSLAGELCDFYCGFDELTEKIRTNDVLMLDSFLGARYPEGLQPKNLYSITAKQLPSYGGSLETAVSDLEHYKNTEYSTIVLCAGSVRAENLRQILSERGITVSLDLSLNKLPDPGSVTISLGGLTAGIEYTSIRLAILTEGQITGAGKLRTASKKKVTNRGKLSSFTDLNPGDLVVHENHGIGRFVGIEQLELDGVVKDYIKIAYLGTDSLFLPATQLDLISKYIGGGEESPVRLNRLGGDTWNKTKSRAKAAAKDMAKELIALYAERQRVQGHAFAPDDAWQREFEDAFEYTETEDQLRCAVEIKADMESSLPMDRLLCGDVGFGKTEVALRAVMKCVLDGKQAAILVPTTVLAQQHYLTAINRFHGFPINIDVLSRFRTAAQHRATLRNLTGGAVDLVIGTHRLLQKDVKFDDLGLLIVDEEQRFGVTHKERLKELSRQVDVLTLSATPIPRTLNMALSGIRDMSTIEEPPQDRHPVQTYVMEHNWQVLGDAIRRELARGGQVYYLHNRIDSIERTASRIAAIAEGSTVAVAHGRMNDVQLSEVMQSMSDGEIQVLVCTTIIEAGIDIPNVNTLIIEDADKLGLSQLHQIRGRVGRSSRHAFAYLTFRENKVLTEVAEKRLTAIREFAEFGSGFKIAMRDLEIRGAGNLLGSEQSGHMMSVGYDMYLKLLEEAVLEEKGEQPEITVSCTCDLVISANIPDRYISSGEQRMDAYRRIATIRSEADADDVTDELIDRYGDPPRSVNALISIAMLRAAASEIGVSDISQKSGNIIFTIDKLNFEAVSYICGDELYKKRIHFSVGDKPVITLKMQSGDDPITAASKFVARFASYCGQPQPS